jgi:hypothetical protein
MVFAIQRLVDSSLELSSRKRWALAKGEKLVEVRMMAGGRRFSQNEEAELSGQHRNNEALTTLSFGTALSGLMPFLSFQ